MMLKAAAGVLLFCAILDNSQGEKVTFDRRFTYQVVDESKLDAATKAGLADLKNTGSKLFDGSKTDKDDKLGTYIYVKDFKSSKSKYFRANPVFVRCIDKVFSQLESSDAGYRLLVDSGFKAKSEASNGKEHDDYARSGTAAIITYRMDSKVKDVLDIAKQAMIHCPSIFASIQRDIGITLMAKGVGIHMRGPDDRQPFYSSDGGSKSTADFKTWCLGKIDEGFNNAPKVADCGSTGLKTGETFPTGAASPEKIVGRISFPVTRQDVDDFKRLHQFQGNVIEFENTEGTSSWCGKEGNPCRSSSQGIYGSGLNDRIADRTMSPRMYNVLEKLQKPVRVLMKDKLVVTEAWDEAHSGAANGDSPVESLHKEGRQVEVKLKNGGSLVDLTKHAICAGADFVKNNGASATMAVRKQANLEEKKIEFGPDYSMLEVALPDKYTARYIHPLEGDSKSQYPFFYGDYQDDVHVDDDATVKMFRSGETCDGSADCPEDDDDYRYFRLSPAIVKCFTHLKAKVKKEINKTLEVETGYLSKEELAREIDANTDPRGAEMSFGYGMQVNYPDFNPCRLAEMAVEQCAEIADADEEQQLGLGLYKEYIYVDIRDEFSVWAENAKQLPKECNNTEVFEDDLAMRFKQTILGQRIDPDDDEAVLENADPPKPQSPSYKFTHSVAIQERRRLRQSTKPDDECKPETDTEFCKSTQKHRDVVVADLWDEITRKYHEKEIGEIKKALEGCLGACGTCMEGVAWEDKLENCQNLIHWISFSSCGDGEGKDVHFYSSDNLEARRHAYHPSHLSPDRSALYALFAAPIKKLYRPDPEKSVQEELYSPENNPSPLMDLVKRMCAFSGKGKAVVWLSDDTEAIAMKNVLRVLMVYNKNLTEIDLMVPNDIAAQTVGAVIENFVAEWTKSSSLKYSRQYITPFNIKTSWPQSRKKRDTEDEHDYVEDFILERRNHEVNWIENL